MSGSKEEARLARSREVFKVGEAAIMLLPLLLCAFNISHNKKRFKNLEITNGMQNQPHDHVPGVAEQLGSLSSLCQQLRPWVQRLAGCLQQGTANRLLA